MADEPPEYDFAEGVAQAKEEVSKAAMQVAVRVQALEGIKMQLVEQRAQVQQLVEVEDAEKAALFKAEAATKASRSQIVRKKHAEVEKQHRVTTEKATAAREAKEAEVAVVEREYEAANARVREVEEVQQAAEAKVAAAEQKAVEAAEAAQREKDRQAAMAAATAAKGVGTINSPYGSPTGDRDASPGAATRKGDFYCSLLSLTEGGKVGLESGVRGHHMSSVGGSEFVPTVPKIEGRVLAGTASSKSKTSGVPAIIPVMAYPAKEKRSGSPKRKKKGGKKKIKRGGAGGRVKVKV